MNVFAVSLPMPPSSNNMFATDFKTKRRFVTKDYATWKTVAGAALMAGWTQAGSPMFDKHLAVTLHLGLNYRGDISGRIKAIEDLMVQTLPGFPDDRWTDRLEIERVPTIEGARVMVQQLAPPAGRRGEAVAIGELIPGIIAGILTKANGGAA